MSLPVVLIASLALIALVLVVLRAASAPDTPAQARTPAAKRRLAKRLQAKGHSAKAGELYLAAGDKAAALDTFLSAGLLARAAPILEETGDLHAALEAYEAGGEHAKAGHVAERMGDPVRAAQHHEMVRGWKDAARCWTAAGDHARSANAWWNQREYARAADAFERAERWLEAARIYRAMLDAVNKGDASGAVKKSYDPAELGKRAGRCFARAGEMRHAADSLAIGGLLAEAAQAYASVGAREAAAAMYLRLGRFADAADMLEQDGKREQAAAIRARVELDAGNHRMAAAQLERAGDLEGAARLLTRLGEHLRAATLYERKESWVSAALSWVQAGREAMAAAAWERAGDRDQAVALYRGVGDAANELRLRESAGEWVRAGELRLQTGDAGGAEQVLKRVGEEDPAHREACRLLGEAYRAQGNPSAAAVKYRQAVEERRPGAATAETYYWAGVSAQEAREHRTALSLLTQLREFDPTYRDIQVRLEDVQRAVADEVVRSGTAAGRYERRDMLGQGGMGTVYRALDVVLDREVAFKVLPPRQTGHPKAREWFLREARSAAVLNHPNIVTVFDFGEIDGDLFMAMELVHGATLKAVYDRQGPMSVGMLTQVTSQACDALEYAHDRGVIHRDIKPANLLWTPAGRLKITDFGLAKMISLDPEAVQDPDDLRANEASALLRASRRQRKQDTSQSRLFGTPAYMSPEQIHQKRVGPKADLYALGVMLFELATGRLPFTTANLLQAHLYDRPEKPRAVRPDLPEWFDEMVMNCLRKDPAKRFDGAAAMRAALPEV